MTLDAYMKKMKLGDVAMAERLGLERTYVGRLRRGLRRPSPGVISTIARETGMAVQFEDWFPPSQNEKKGEPNHATT